MKDTKNHIDQVLERYFRGKYTRDDLDHIANWIKKAGSDVSGKAPFEAWWEEVNREDHTVALPEFDPAQLLDRIHHQINMGQATSGQGKIPKVSRSSIRPLLWQVAAALIFLAVGFALSQLLPSSLDTVTTTISAPGGHKTNITLPEGTDVWLNGETTVSYNANISEKREITLTGEALFKVQKSDGIPFIVHTDHLDIEVLGTTFNVRAYPEDSDVEIGLAEGRIRLSRKGVVIATISPGQVARLDKQSNKLYIESQQNINAIMAWANDELIFDNQPFAEVISYIERWYGVDIDLDEQLKYAHNFTFKVKTESLRELLDLINVITPIEYEINGKQVSIRKAN